MVDEERQRGRQRERERERETEHLISETSEIVYLHFTQNDCTNLDQLTLQFTLTGSL